MPSLNRSVACAVSATFGLVAAVTLALPAAAQPLNELPDLLAPDLPPGVKHLCAGPIVPDLPPGELQAVASASGELPPLPEWCDGTCTIDIAFFYDPEVLGMTGADVFGDDADNPNEPWGPRTIGELKARVSAAIDYANVAFRRAGLDAELRFVGMERDPGLAGLDGHESVFHVRTERLTHARESYGADLVYALPRASIPGLGVSFCGLAHTRMTRQSREFAAAFSATGAISVLCLGPSSALAHEVGHNLGLDHHPEDTTTVTPFVPFGHGYEGQTKFGRRHGTIMHSAGGRTAHFSTPELLHGRILGNADVSDATRALRYTIPDAVRYSPTVVPKKDEDPHGYGCRPSRSGACLNERRFNVAARYSTQSVSRAPAKRLDTYGLGDSGALYYFFGPDNPEMLVKVVNGCWLNDHWWVFGSAATDLVYELVIDDLADGGGTVEYRHNGGGVIVGDNGYSTAAGVINDTSAFPCGRTAAVPAHERGTAEWPVVKAGREQGALAGIVAVQENEDLRDYGCPPSTTASCLNNWRFRVRGGWESDDRNGSLQSLQTHGLGDSGALFYFFGRDNPEMLVKVVDGCAINGHWWVFGSAATDLRYEIVIYDYATASLDSEGRVRIGHTNWYRHHGGGRITGPNGYSTRAGVINDTSTFPCNQ